MDIREVHSRGPGRTLAALVALFALALLLETPSAVVAQAGGGFFRDPQYPDFEFRVQIGPAGDAITGTREAVCQPDTVCVSGALPGRSELFLRILGPRPNGFLWPTIVRFTPSRVVVDVKQLSTGKTNRYILPAVGPSEDDLGGLQDRTGFSPRSRGGADTIEVRTSALKPLEVFRPRGAGFFSDPQYPDFLFRVHIGSAGSTIPGTPEGACQPDTVCVSGALPGRSEVFLRLLGPRPNGFLWPTIVRFTPSRVVVDIEQISSGESKRYVLQAVGPADDDLSGRQDRTGFEPPPDEPPTGGNLQGTWVGTATSLSASGTCLAENFHPLTVSARWAIQQNGSSFTGQLTLNNAITCPFKGTVQGSSATFFADVGGASFCTVQARPCPGAPERPLRLELRLNLPVQVGTINGNRMTATGTSTWRVTDLQTGQVLGDFKVTGRQDLQKQ